MATRRFHVLHNAFADEFNAYSPVDLLKSKEIHQHSASEEVLKCVTKDQIEGLFTKHHGPDELFIMMFKHLEGYM